MPEKKVSSATEYTFGRCLEEFPDERFELIDGTVFMTPPPSYRHQDISSNLVGELWSFLRKSKKDCRVYHAPTGLFFEDHVKDLKKEKGYVEPDVFITCSNMRTDGFVVGTPHLVIEILSPSTSKHDKVVKLNLYQKNKVREYWIVDPLNEIVDVYKLLDEHYQFPITYTKEDSLTFVLDEADQNGEDKIVIQLQTVFS